MKKLSDKKLLKLYYDVFDILQLDLFDNEETGKQEVCILDEQFTNEELIENLRKIRTQEWIRFDETKKKADDSDE